MLTSLALILAAATAVAGAAAPNRPIDISTPILRGATVGALSAPAAGDTLLLMGAQGSGAPTIGNFESPGGGAAWNGWTSVDDTRDTGTHWQASQHLPVSGAWSAWCGDPTLPSCGGVDLPGGYGNNWDTLLEWRGTVADPQLPCTVRVQALVSYDSEPGYDYSWLSCVTAAGPVDIWSADGAGTAVPLDETHVYQPADYVDGDQVVVQFRFTSDGGYSDEDCQWISEGALRVDDVVIGLDNGTGAATGFEDGSLAPFVEAFGPGVGDFAKLWTGLRDLDPCLENGSTQVGFIDDGVVVPGTGGTACTIWCYGPGGYVVNYTGGLLGPDAHLHNAVVSPPIPWGDPAHQGALLSYSAYLHEGNATWFTGVVPEWFVRSVSSGDPADLENERWEPRNFIYLAPPGYYRFRRDLDGFFPPDRTHVQIRLGVYDAGWIWGWDGDGGTPAPYFDNVRFETYTMPGPDLWTREGFQANDGFPANGELDLGDLGRNSVRFDMATNISPAEHLRNDPGDSVVINVTVRPGAALTAAPRLHYRLLRNPVFDAVRSSGLPDVGTVDCANAAGLLVGGWWWADLPDTGFIFPGDVLRWCFEASDDLAGDLRTALLPADTTGFSTVDPYLSYHGDGYPAAFTMRALPSVDGNLGQPGVLFWHDSGADHDWEEWLRAMTYATGGTPGLTYDIFHTKEAMNGLGNGLGGRASAAQLAGYGDILHTAGDMDAHTISIGNPALDASDDVDLLDAWLRLGGKDLMVSGNQLVGDMDGLADWFLDEWMGVELVAYDQTPLLDGLVTPTAYAVAGNPVFSAVGSWVVYGAGCLGPERAAGFVPPGATRVNAVRPLAGTDRLAGFGFPDGSALVPDLAAATLHEVAAHAASVVVVPADLALVWTDPDEAAKASASDPARDRLVRDLLAWFGVAGGGVVAGVPEAAAFSIAPSPNPFNPVTSIAYTVAGPGRLSLKIFDLRGRLVRTLVDGPVAGPGTVTWDGSDVAGRQAASGVYFYEARFGEAVKVGKLALVK